jgi:Fe-S cluster biogenesis protein NfuA
LKNKRKNFKMIKDRVQKSLDKVRPMLQQDGGDVELVDVDEDRGIVKVNLTGACKGCPMSQITLKSGIERFLQSEIPEVTSVVEA